MPAALVYEQRSMRVKFVGDEGFAPLSFLRLAFFLAAFTAGIGVIVLRAAHADVNEALWSVGSRVMDFPGAPSQPARQLHLNGVRVSFRTQVVDASLEDVLAHYEANCGSPIATQTARNEFAGYVACLDVGEAQNDLRALTRRLLRFSETGDLRDLGDPRYIFARRDSRAANDMTFFLTVWAEADFNLHQVVPRPGADAAGSDLVGVPRPSGAQRLLSAWEARGPSGVVVYRVSEQSSQGLESFYRTELSERGWTITERHSSQSTQIDGTRILFAEKHNRLVTVLARAGKASSVWLTLLASEPS